MPGIVGLITKKPRTWAEPQLHSMLEAMTHESFYETGTWIDESLGVYVGWTVAKNSFAAGVPVRNECGNVVLIFSGEEFPDPDLVEGLKQRGHDIMAEGASYLVHVYEEDPNFPVSLNGRFQGLVADCRRKTVTLFNDRYGMNMLYYHEAKEGFYFSAEAKAILKVRPELRSLDMARFAETAVFRSVRDNRTIFKGIDTVPPGSSWVFKHGALTRKTSYFQPREWEDQGSLSPESYYRELRDVFAQNLPRYFNSDEAIGMTLTGGLDTRMIMAWQREPAGSLPCYTFGGMHRQCEDVTVAQRVAKACSQPHKVIPVKDEFLSQFARYAERSIFLTDGCASVEASPLLYVQEKGRQIAPVRISGTYGSEVLRGPAIFKPAKLQPHLFHPDFLADMETTKERYASNQRHAVSSVVFQETSIRGFEAVERTQLAIRTPFLDNQLVRIAFRAPKSGVTKADIFANNDVCNQLIADGSSPLRDIQTDRGLAGKKGFAGTLKKHLLEFTFRAEYAYDYGMPQSLARIDHALRPLHLERLFLGRHKYYHFRTWYRSELSGYVREMLLDPRTLSRPYLERRSVEAAVNSHLKGDRNYTVDIHQLLTLELIQRLFVDPGCSP